MGKEIIEEIVNNMKRIYFIAGIFLTCLVLSAVAFSCKNNVRPEQFAWKLVELNGDENSVFVDGDAFTLKFLSDEGKISGSGACNHFFGTYTIDLSEKTIALKIGGTTMMAGPNIEFERPYFDALKSVDRYKFSKEKLRLFAGKKLVAEFKVHSSKK